MSDIRNGKFRKHSSHLRRRSRSTETPENFSSFRDVETGEVGFDFDPTPISDVQPSEGCSVRQSNSESTRTEDNKRGIVESNDEERPELSTASSSSTAKPLECAICLQSCVHPARLPCSHVFCFLCLKGIARGPHTCAMCRAPIPPDYTDNPELVPVPQEVKDESADVDKYAWFYEGRNGSGWWQYDTRTSAELEQCYQRGETKTEVLIAGYLYTVDLDEMMQARKNEPARRRAIKRDVITCPKKGIAGLRQPVLSGLCEAMSRLNIRNN